MKKEKGTNLKTDIDLKSAIGKIKSQVDYDKIMMRIDELVAIGDEHLNTSQAKELRSLSLAIHQYERSIYTIKPPATFDGVLEMKMYELKLKQGEMAKRLNISDAKFSLILKGKQKPDIQLLKTLHHDFNIDGNFLLSVL